MAISLITSLLFSLPQQWQPVVLTGLLPVIVSLVLLARKGRLKMPPGPEQVPLLGNLHQLAGPQPHRALRDLARVHGPVMRLRLGKASAVVLTSAEAAWEALRGHDLDCCTRPVSAGTRRVTYGMKNVAFAPYGAYWREVRKLLMVELLSARRVKAAWYARHEQVSVTKPVVKSTLLAKHVRLDFIHYCCMVLSRGWFLSSVIFYICHVSLICARKIILPPFFFNR